MISIVKNGGHKIEINGVCNVYVYTNCLQFNQFTTVQCSMHLPINIHLELQFLS